MQSFNNIVKVLLLVTIYCFGLVNSADALTNFNQTPLSENSAQKSYFTASTKLLSPHAQQTEVSVSDVAEVVSPNYKLPFTGFTASLNSIDFASISRYRQYILYAKTLLIKFKKTDLIFPFHNFW